MNLWITEIPNPQFSVAINRKYLGTLLLLQQICDVTSAVLKGFLGLVLRGDYAIEHYFSDIA